MDKAAFLATARAEAARMQGVAGSADPEGEVRMSVAQFGQLAGMVGLLVDLASVQPGPSEDEAPGDPRYWVPLAHYSQLKTRYEALRRDAQDFADLQQAMYRAA